MDETLRSYLKREKVDLSHFIELFIKIVEVVRAYHNDFHVYKKLTLDSILFHVTTNTIQLFDNEHLESFDIDDLPYISPEGTGKLHRKLDHRSNFYSLGIIFYEILAGRYPYNVNERLEWIHAHLTEMPLSLTEEIPTFIQLVVMKCLAKLPEERYQSAEGLLFDLKAIQAKINGQITSFPIAVGTADIPRALRISRKLYGRDNEIRLLREAFARARDGDRLTCLIYGEEGTGKSSLISTFLDSEVVDDTFVGIGKMPRNHIVLPFAPLAEACRVLLQNILASDDLILDQFQRVFSENDWPSIFLEIIPELAHFIKNSIKINDQTGIEHFEQVKLSFRSFFRIIGSLPFMTIIVLDDFHIADEQTRDIITYLTRQNDNHALLWIIGWRVDFIEIPDENWVTIYLSNLEENSISMMLIDTLTLFDSSLNPLTSLIMEKSKGNPYKIRKFLLEIIENRFLFYDSDACHWVVQYEEISELDCYVNQFFPMSLSWIDQVEPDCMNSIYWLACLGSTSIDTLENISAISTLSLRRYLTDASSKGLIVVNDKGSIRFITDQIQEMVYQKMNKEEQEHRHDMIANYFLYNENQNKDTIYQVVFHLKLGRKINENRSLYATCHLRAGIHAKNSAAYEFASSLFLEGYQALRYSDWEDFHDVRWNLVWHLSFCEYAQNHVYRAEYYLDQAVRMARTEDQIFKAFKMKILLSTHRGQLHAALENGFIGLTRLGFSMSRLKTKDSKLRLVWTRLKLLRRESPLKFLKKNIITQHSVLRQMELLYSISTAVFRYQPKRLVYISEKILWITSRYGISAESAIGIIGYSMYYAEQNRSSRIWREYAIVALRIARRFQSPIILTIIYFTYAVFLEPWYNEYNRSIDHLEQASAFVEKTGDVTVGSYVGDFLLLFRWLQGKNFDSEDNFFYISTIKYPSSIFHQETSFKKLLRVYFSYLKMGIKGSLLEYPWDEAEISIRYYMLLITCTVAVVWNDSSLGELISNPILTDIPYLSYTLPDQILYYAIYSIRSCFNWDHLNRDLAIRRVNKYKNIMLSSSIKKYNHHLYRVFLLDAALFALNSEFALALDQLYRAGEQARQVQHFLMGAICFEEASKIAHHLNRIQLRDFYFQRSAILYEQCGLYEKASHLIHHLDHRLPTVTKNNYFQGTTSIRDLAREVDVDVLLDVMRSISEEVMLGKLLNKLLHNVIMFASAQRGIILLKGEDEELFVMVEGSSMQMNIELYERIISVNDYDDLPKNIVKYVHRTKEAIVLQNATQDIRFSNDPYLILEQVQSVMCIPIVKLGMTIGVIYLEHRTIPQLFTPKEVRFASMIGSQAAISIENSRLYEMLESKILERTAELEISNQNLLEINDRLLQSESLRRQMISDISHDLRTPLTSIQGYIEAVLENVVTGEDVQNYLSIARDRSMQMNHLIQDLLDLSKFDEHQGNLHREMVSVIDLVNAIFRRHQFDVEHAGLHFETLLDPLLKSLDFVDWDFDYIDRELFVRIDIRRVDQVFSNLIYNAIRHTKSGGTIRVSVKLTGDPYQITENASFQSEYVRFDIIDNGTGISGEDLPFIFERFYRADRARQKDTGGSGLGLAISKAIIESHDGFIYAESKLGVGSTFSVVLPIAATVFEPFELLE